MPATLVSNATDVAKWVQEKQALEVELSWEMIDCFNKPDLLNPIRAACARALEDMIIAGKNSLQAANAVKQAIDDEKAAMKLLAKKAPPKPNMSEAWKVINELGIINVLSLPKLLAQVDEFNCQECSDMIRLYGAFVEKAAGSVKEISAQLGKTYAEIDKDKTGAKKNTDGTAVAKAGASPVWNTLGQDGKPILNAKTNKPWEFGRWRERAIGQYDALFKKKAGPTQTGEQGYFEITNVQQFLGMMKGGSAIWSLKDGSTVSKIDQLFGLVPASDISGTTTDTIHFLESFIGKDIMGGMDSIFYMLPLATIVAGAHHSWIEVALPLTQAKKLDYHIGDYNSAMVKTTSSNAAINAIKEVLKKATADKRNRQMLVYYKADKQIEGAFSFALTDANWKAFSQAEKALAACQKMKPWPKKADVEAIMKEAKLS